MKMKWQQQFGTYNIDLKIEDYFKDDTIKLVTLTITYQTSKNNTEKLEMQRIKTK